MQSDKSPLAPTPKPDSVATNPKVRKPAERCIVCLTVGGLFLWEMELGPRGYHKDGCDQKFHNGVWYMCTSGLM